MAPPFITTPTGPPTAGLTRAVKVGGRDALLAVMVEVWGAGAERSEFEARLANGIATVFERRSGSTTARVKAALEAADRWLRQAHIGDPGPSPTEPGNGSATGGGEAPGLGAGASVLVLAGEEAILAQVGPTVAYVRVPDPDTGGRPDPVRHPAASPWLRRGIEGLTPQPLWSPLGMGGSPPVGALDDAEPEPDIHWAHWWMAPGSSALLTTTAAALLLSREVVGPLLATPPDQIGPALSATLPRDLPALHIAHREAPAPAPAGSPTPAPAVRSTPMPAGSPGQASQPPASSPEARSDLDAALPPKAPRSMPAFPSLTVPEIDLAPAWLAVREAARNGAIGAARFGAQVLFALLPARSGQGASSYQGDWGRFAAAAAVLLPLAVLGLVLIMLARAREGTLVPALPNAPPVLKLHAVLWDVPVIPVQMMVVRWTASGRR